MRNDGPTRMLASLVWIFDHIEKSDEPDIDRIHDAVLWGLNTRAIRNRTLLAELTATLQRVGQCGAPAESAGHSGGGK